MIEMFVPPKKQHLGEMSEIGKGIGAFVSM